MATLKLLRCTKGARLLLQPQLMKHQVPAVASPELMSRVFGTTPQLTIAVPEFFRARRGPYSPAEKKGKGHMMMASTHWKTERILAISMLGIMPACLFYPVPFMDHLLSTAVLMHGFWGMDGVFTDYVEKFFPYIHYIWYVVTILAFVGLVNFNYNDVGVCKAIQMVWRLDNKDKK